MQNSSTVLESFTLPVAYNGDVASSRILKSIFISSTWFHGICKWMSMRVFRCVLLHDCVPFEFVVYVGLCVLFFLLWDLIILQLDMYSEGTWACPSSIHKSGFRFLWDPQPAAKLSRGSGCISIPLYIHCISASYSYSEAVVMLQWQMPVDVSISSSWSNFNTPTKAAIDRI